jgi:hypothetical protein
MKAIVGRCYVRSSTKPDQVILDVQETLPRLVLSFFFLSFFLFLKTFGALL